MKNCEWCGGEITDEKRRKLCSNECVRLMRNHREMERQKSLRIKCKNCGKPLENDSFSWYCCEKCKTEFRCKTQKEKKETIKKHTEKPKIRLYSIDDKNSKHRYIDYQKHMHEKGLPALSYGKWVDMIEDMEMINNGENRNDRMDRS